MKLKEIFTKAGPISDYLVYIIILFGWYLAHDIYLTMIQPRLPSEVLGTLLSWGLRLLVSPIIFAGVIGAIHDRQKTQNELDRAGFFSHAKAHFWGFLGANLFSVVFYFVAVVIVVLLLTGIAQQDSADANHDVLLSIISAFFALINLIWFPAIVVEQDMFRALARSLKTFLSSPVAIITGLLWAGLSFADNLNFGYKIEQVPLVVSIASAAVFSVTRVLATMLILVIHKTIWGDSSTTAAVEQFPLGVSQSHPGEKLARVSLGFTCFSFVPLLHLVALVLGALALKRSQRLILKAAAACWVGGFFTILYALIVAGLFIGQSNNFRFPSYAFLSAANTDLESYVQLLDQDAESEVLAQLADPASSSTDRHWAFDGALALAKYKANDLNGALENFYTAMQKKPERSEFYFYYGLALLDNEKNDMALEQFQQALQHEPKLEIAEKYIALLKNTYQPDRLTSALMYIVILIILFTVHEYGHAFAAWKLGDETAKNQGRLTLNPIVHLDIFGSLLLPAIFLLQGSDTILGWARPVPVNPAYFKNPRKDHVLVAFAGPAVNLMVAMLCMLLLGLIVLIIRLLWPATISMNLADPYSAVSLVGPPLSKGILIFIVFLKQLFYTSLILGFFNLIPVPPLDGSWILEGLLPQSLSAFFAMIRPYSFILFLLLARTPLVSEFLGIPIGIAWAGLHLIVSAIGLA